MKDFFKCPDAIRRGGRPRRYSQEDLDRIEELHDAGKTFDEIGVLFNVKGSTIENKYYEHICKQTTDKPLRVPNFSGWDFSDNAA